MREAGISIFRQLGKKEKHRCCGIFTAGLIVLLTALGVSCSEKGSASPVFDQQTINQMTQAVCEEMEKNGIPGAIVGAWVPGRGDWTMSSGLANIQTSEDMEIDNLMRIGSITKSFTATLVLELVDQNLLELNDPLAKYFPWVPNALNITLLMLLNHTSGIVDDYQNPAFWDIASSNPLYKWQPEELVKASLGTDPDAVPGKDCNYSNANYLLLGMIVEKITGKKLPQLMEEYIFEPLGLTSTQFAESPEISEKHSHSYVKAGNNGKLYDMTSGIDPSITWAAGAILSTLEDVKKWAQALGSGALLKQKTHEQQLQWVDVLGLKAGAVIYQYGLGILKLGDFIGHNGEFSGFQATMFYLPAEKAVIVVLINSNISQTGSQDIFSRIASILFPGKV